MCVRWFGLVGGRCGGGLVGQAGCVCGGAAFWARFALMRLTAECMAGSVVFM